MNALLLTSLLLFALRPLTVVRCQQVLCRQFFSVGAYRDDSLPDCRGDFCFAYRNRDTLLTLGGCVTGVPRVAPRCYPAADETVCFCNTPKEHCNSLLDVDMPPKDTSAESRYCDSFDSRLPNDTQPSKCKTERSCYYRLEKYETQPGVSIEVETRGCRPVFSVDKTPHQLLVSQVGRNLLAPTGCLQTQHDASGGVTDCVCQPGSSSTGHCNAIARGALSPSALTAFGLRNTSGFLMAADRRRLVQCHMMSKGERRSATCLADYCYIVRGTLTFTAGRHPDAASTGGSVSPMRRGCLNVSADEPTASVGYRRFDLATAIEEVWLCDDNLCNFDLQSAERSIRNKLLPPQTPSRFSAPTVPKMTVSHVFSTRSTTKTSAEPETNMATESVNSIAVESKNVASLTPELTTPVVTSVVIDNDVVYKNKSALSSCSGFLLVVVISFSRVIS